jgi:hypothetical protein
MTLAGPWSLHCTAVFTELQLSPGLYMLLFGTCSSTTSSSSSSGCRTWWLHMQQPPSPQCKIVEHTAASISEWLACREFKLLGGLPHGLPIYLGIGQLCQGWNAMRVLVRPGFAEHCSNVGLTSADSSRLSSGSKLDTWPCNMNMYTEPWCMSKMGLHHTCSSTATAATTARGEMLHSCMPAQLEPHLRQQLEHRHELLLQHRLQLCV